MRFLREPSPWTILSGIDSEIFWLLPDKNSGGGSLTSRNRYVPAPSHDVPNAASPNIIKTRFAPSPIFRAVSLSTPGIFSRASMVVVVAIAKMAVQSEKYLFGDWVYFQDTVNGVLRLISPQGYVAGLMANLGPQNSELNKPIYGAVGTQKSYANQIYSNAELQALIQGGLDVIANPSPGGAYFSCQSGHSSSSNATIQGDNYSRMTNYIAYTMNAGIGSFVGKLQSQQANDPLRRNVTATLSNFFVNLQTATPPQIDDFTVLCDSTNNSASRISLGYLQADVKVRYLAVVEKFIINVEGGQTVTITRTSTAPAQQ